MAYTDFSHHRLSRLIPAGLIIFSFALLIPAPSLSQNRTLTNDIYSSDINNSQGLTSGSYPTSNKRISQKPNLMNMMPSRIPSDLNPGSNPHDQIDDGENRNKHPRERDIQQSNIIENMYNNMYREVLETPLTQYGYEFFIPGIRDMLMPAGDAYRVGPGDNICIYLWGYPVDVLGLQGFYPLMIDRDGKVFIPNLGTFYIWGMQIADVKTVIKNAMSKKFKNFELDVTLGALRQFPVYVAGYVQQPGIVLANGMSSVLDILALAGGVDKNGSLRSITLKRKEKDGEKIIPIDLYELFFKGNVPASDIHEGDTIVVGPVGISAAVSGEVRRPAIYEFSNCTVRDLLQFAGNPLPSSYSSGLKLFRIKGDTLNMVQGSTNDTAFLDTRIENGDLLFVETLRNTITNEIEVDGYIGYPGKYPHKKNLKLSSIIKNFGILPETNIYTAEVRRDDDNIVIPFIPVEVINGKKDIDLKERDKIYFYPKWLYQPVMVSGDIEEPIVIPYYRGISLLDVMKHMKFRHPTRELKAEVYTKAPQEIFSEDERNMSIDENDSPAENSMPASATTNRERQNTLANKTKTAGKNPMKTKRDSVNPGDENLLKAENVKSIQPQIVYLYDLLLRADRASNLLLKPGMTIQIRRTEPSEKGKTITILGEITNPGMYNFREGMKLHDLIIEAGGYTSQAYPRGLIFIRNSARRIQEEQIKIANLSMQEYATRQQGAFSALGGSPEEGMIAQMMVTQYQKLMDILREKSQMALGRMALDIPSNADELKKSKDNIELVDADYIYIPQKPNYVLVLGNVYNQLSLPHRPGMTLSQYIDELGGTTKDADTAEMYIIKASGKIISRRNYSSFFNFTYDGMKRSFTLYRSFESLPLEEGDAIVIPAELNVPIMWRAIIKDVTQIAFQSLSTLVLAKSL